ncbi:MAG: sensor histidine kinase, partial [Verrucomicrobia bacterium]
MRRLLLLALLAAPLSLLAGPSGWTDPAAGLPALRIWNIPSNDSVYWCVVRDHRGRLYIGADKVHAFDGSEWTTIAVANGYNVRRMAVDDANRVWVGAINEIGYLEEGPDGRPLYVSLTAHLPEGMNLGDVWKVHVQDKHTLFVTKDRLLIWDGERFVIHHLPNDVRLFSFRFRDGVAVSQPGTGMWFWKGSSLKPLDFSGWEKVGIAFAGHLGGDRYIIDPEGQLGVIENGTFTRLPHNAEGALQGAASTAAVSLPDGNICIATFLRGLVIISPEGELLRVVDRLSGLPSLNCVDLYLDSHDNLWVTTTSAVVQLRADNAVTLFRSLNGLASAPVHLMADTAALGPIAFTSEHIAALQPSTDPRTPARFDPVEGLHDFFWDALAIDEHRLLFGGRYFLREWSPTKVEDVVQSPDTFFRLLPYTAGKAIVAEGSAIRLYSIDGRPTALRTLVENLPEQPADLALDASGTLWVTLPRHGILAIELRPEPSGTPSVSELLPSQAFSTASTDPRLFVLDGRAYTYNQQEIHLLRAGNPPSTQPVLPGLGLFTAEREGDSAIWAVSNSPGQKPQLIRLEPAEGGMLEATAMDSSLLHPIGTPRSIVSRPRHHDLWIAGSASVARIDTALLAPAPPPPRPVILGARWRTPAMLRHLPFVGVERLPFNAESHLTFEVRPGTDILDTHTTIETRLAGLETAWTPTNGRRTFTGLHEGDFVFEARALDFRGRPGPVARFPVIIDPPWHRSGWAYTAYVITLALGVWGVIVLRTRRVARLNAQLERLVNARTQELARASAARSAFLATMGHEIRNPLNGVVGLVESLRQTNLDEKARETLERLAACARQLASVVEDVLEFSKLDAGRISVKLQPFHVRDPINAAVDVFRAAAPDASISVEAARPLLAERVIGDPDRIRQILINYLANAIKFAGRGEITVGAKREDGFLTFFVADQGPGIPKEEQQRLFLRFSRGRSAHKNNIPGTGLGLAACKAYADAMGAEVWVESEVNLGATFFLRLPFRRAVGRDAVPTVVAGDIMVGRKA